jgi:hypothetical protein
MQWLAIIRFPGKCSIWNVYLNIKGEDKSIYLAGLEKY